MTMVGGFDVHRKQITFDYVDNDGLVRWGQIRPATRTTLRRWLDEHCPDGDAEFALEGCTGWRYVSQELAAADVGVHLGDPAEIATLRGPKKRAKTDRADARLLRTLLLEGRFPESWIPPAQVLETRTLGRLYCTLMDERRASGNRGNSTDVRIRTGVATTWSRHRSGSPTFWLTARRASRPSTR